MPLCRAAQKPNSDAILFSPSHIYPRTPSTPSQALTKLFNMSSTTNDNILDQAASTIKQGVNYVSETAQEYTSGASKEANKQEAKDSSNSLSDRASAAFNAAGDKIDESGHGAKADAHKEAAKH